MKPHSPHAALLIPLLLCLIGSGRAAEAVASPASEPGWVSLFDGHSLTGWVQWGGKAKYRAAEGEIIGTPVVGEGNSFLCTGRHYTNFVLELEFKVVGTLNSGVQVRSRCFDHPTEIPSKGKVIRVPAGRVHGLQSEIDPSERAWTAGLYEEGARGWLQDLKENEPARKAYKAGEWNTMRVECRGDQIRTWLNEVPAATLRDDRVMAGFIGLQVHAVKEPREAEVRFRNLRLKELQGTP